MVFFFFFNYWDSTQWYVGFDVGLLFGKRVKYYKLNQDVYLEIITDDYYS